VDKQAQTARQQWVIDNWKWTITTLIALVALVVVVLALRAPQ
jgi:uncharacterized protein YpmS